MSEQPKFPDDEKSHTFFRRMRKVKPYESRRESGPQVQPGGERFPLSRNVLSNSAVNAASSVKEPGKTIVTYRKRFLALVGRKKEDPSTTTIKDGRKSDHGTVVKAGVRARSEVPTKSSPYHYCLPTHKRRDDKVGSMPLSYLIQVDSTLLPRALADVSTKRQYQAPKVGPQS
jgi:hypothetical protein